MSKVISRSVPSTISSSSDAVTPSMTGTLGMFSMHTCARPKDCAALSMTRQDSLAMRMLLSRVSGTERLIRPGWIVTVSIPAALAHSIYDRNSSTVASLMRGLTAARSVSAMEVWRENVIPEECACSQKSSPRVCI